MQRIVRYVVMGLVVASVVSGGIALASGKSGDFKPGKGCGDKRHTHYREDECNKPPRGHHEHESEHGGSGHHSGHVGRS